MLEVGSWIGSSALTWLEAARDFGGAGRLVCADLWQPYMKDALPLATCYPHPLPTDSVDLTMNIALEADLPFQIFQYNLDIAGFSDKVAVLKGDSAVTLPLLAPGQFDLIYLDGSHLYSMVSSDIAQAIRLIRPGGIICGDDLELPWWDCNQAEATAFIETDYLFDSLTGLGFHPGVSKAVFDSFGSVSTWDGFWAIQKTEDGWSPIDLSKTRLDLPTYVPNEEPDQTQALIRAHNDRIMAR